ncbi:chromosome partitioning protein ParA [Vibrio sp. V19_P1S1T109]|uniref:helix-turn-helix domain-containing protein n=1 Tax=Vibrio sp. V19_P1S1T109 TaxID=1938672 RepID=UPI000B8E5A5B|nr:helix-turn-helix domain-containing protein [Vibrio sp. V19_P1S1T109]OXX73282.1 chromosome partitioning protein ParA [Vibrio sp. V19_P1S1T109]
MNKNNKIMPFEYLKGREFTDNLKRVLKCRNLEELGDVLDVPKSTFTTWNAHDRTSHELMVRIHLAKNIPMKELALKSDQPNELGAVGDLRASYSIPSSSSFSNPQHSTVILKSFCLSNGQLLDTGEIPYAVRIFNSWNLDSLTTIEIETNDGRFLVDKNQNDAVSGEYLIDMNGRMSINHIQRLPNKLAVVFGNATVEVAEEDIKVIGRVAVTLKKN